MMTFSWFFYAASSRAGDAILSLTTFEQKGTVLKPSVGVIDVFFHTYHGYKYIEKD